MQQFSQKWRLIQTTNAPFIALLSIMFVGCLSVGCSEPAETSAPVTPRIKVFVVGKEATGQARRISGTVVAADRSSLSFGVSGQVVKVLAKQGQAVTEGQLLARLDDETFQLKLEDARAGVNKARAKLVEARAAYERTSGLVNERAASQKELEAATAALAAANGDVKAAQGALNQAEFDLERTRLTAPFAGQVVDVPMDPFQEVAGSGEVLVLQSDGALDVELLVPETLIRDVDFGQTVQVTFPTLEGVTLSGFVRLIGADVATGNAFSVKVRLTGASDELRAGMTASVTFNFTSYLDDRTAYLVPLSALAIDAALESPELSGDGGLRDKAPLFVYDAAERKVNFRMVDVGDLRGNEIEVFGGLQPGDQVVSAGVAFVRDGMTADVWMPRQ